MVIPVLVGLDHVHQQPRQVQGIGGRADLVAHHPQLVVGLAQLQHGLDEVLAVQAEHPGDPHDEILLQPGADGQLAAQLRLAVVVQGLIVLAVRLPGGLALPIEHIVRGNVHHLAVLGLARRRQMSGAVHVDGPDLGLLVGVLGQVHRRPGGAVDHGVGPHLVHHLPHLLLIGDVHGHIGHPRHGGAVGDAAVYRGNVAAHALMAPAGQLVHHIVAQLTAHARYQYLHCL